MARPCEDVSLPNSADLAFELLGRRVDRLEPVGLDDRRPGKLHTINVRVVKRSSDETGILKARRNQVCSAQTGPG